MKTKFTFTYNSRGYMLYGNGKPLGGARSMPSGRRRAWQSIRADLKMHAESARREIAALEIGRAHV